MSEHAVADGALRAALVPGFSPRRWRRFLSRGGDPAWLGRGGARMLRTRLGIGDREAASLARALARADPAAERARAADAGIAILSWGGAGYPAALTDLPDPPPVLWVRGELSSSHEQAVAMTGSRRPTPYGVQVARHLAHDLARAGVTVVAGVGRGIDAEAHAGAACGRAVAVLAGGLLWPRAPEDLELLDRVARRGAAISEFPLDAAPARLHFPQRSRLVAALAAAAIVVEAKRDSPALGTVRHALDLGRTVMAVPGPVGSPQSEGTLRMLQEGACPVGSATDVFAALGWCDLPPSELPPGERRILDALDAGGLAASEVALALGMRDEEAAGCLITLEVRGLVAREGGRYVLA